MTFLSDFATFFRDGGPFMYVILACAVLILGGALERFWVIARASSWNTRKLMRDVGEHVRRGDLRGAAELAGRVKSPVGQVAAAMLASGARTEESLRSAGDGEAGVVIAPLARGLGYLSLLANTATLLGLLGTIFGLMTAFSGVGAADPSQRSAFLAAGISEALNTTAFGLIVAVPAMLIHAFFANRVERIADAVDEATVRLARVMVGGAPAAAASLAMETVAMAAQGRSAPTGAAPHAHPRTDPRAPQARSSR
ncbi:MAG: MotA/TolQ/ExbB proton channel family protein [bacterium]